MFFRELYDQALAQASYVIGCQATGEAIVVDPLRDPTPYLDEARAEGLRITLGCPGGVANISTNFAGTK